MLCFRNLVNSFFSLRLRFLCRPCSRNHLITLTFSVSAEAEANYNKLRAYRTSPLQEYSLKRVFVSQMTLRDSRLERTPRMARTAERKALALGVALLAII